jgi:hypothetical protein
VAVFHLRDCSSKNTKNRWQFEKTYVTILLQNINNTTKILHTAIWMVDDMNLFSRTKDRRVLGSFQMQKIDTGILKNISDFAKNLTLPEPEYPVEVEVRDSMHQKEMVRAPYWLLVFSEGDAPSLLNAGYVIGQIDAYLHFMGFSSYIPRELPMMTGKTASGKQCVAVIAFGCRKPGRAETEHMQEPELSSGICRNLQEHWTEEVLTLAKKRFHISASNVCIIREDNRISFSPRFRSGKKRSYSEFATGITIAYALAAAEELWVDLVFAKGEDAGHRVCLSAYDRTRHS